MKKRMSIIVIAFALLLLSTSAHSPKTIGNMVGDMAPIFALDDEQSGISLDSLKGQYVILNFWATYDAQSRVSNVKLDKAVSTMKGENVRFVSVCYDRSQSIYKEIVKRDHLNASTQFYDNDGKESKIFDAYSLGKGFKSYLIAPDGSIVAQNPSVEQLTATICQ